MKHTYQTPSLELTRLSSADVISLSLEDGYAFDPDKREHLYDVSDWLS